MFERASSPAGVRKGTAQGQDQALARAGAWCTALGGSHPGTAGLCSPLAVEIDGNREIFTPWLAAIFYKAVEKHRYN